MEIRSPWHTMREAAIYLRFLSRAGQPLPDNARRYLLAQGVPLKKRGRSLLVHIDDLDGTLKDVNGPTPAPSPDRR